MHKLLHGSLSKCTQLAETLLHCTLCHLHLTCVMTRTRTLGHVRGFTLTNDRLAEIASCCSHAPHAGCIRCTSAAHLLVLQFLAVHQRHVGEVTQGGRRQRCVDIKRRLHSRTTDTTGHTTSSCCHAMYAGHCCMCCFSCLPAHTGSAGLRIMLRSSRPGLCKTCVGTTALDTLMQQCTGRDLQCWSVALPARTLISVRHP